MKRKILQFLLKWPTQLMLAKHKPFIVGVTGSVGKTSTKEAIYTVLKKKHFVWQSGKNYNTEIGLPLAVFGIEKSVGSFFDWINVFLKIAKDLMFFKKSYPDFLILEFGVDRPGDMAYLTKLAKPKIGVLTAIGEMPVHVEFFSNPKAILKEKAKLLGVISQEGFAVLNYDDSMIFELKDSLKARVLTYGFNEGADIRATNFEIHSFITEPQNGGISFKINYSGSFVPVKLKNIFGKPQVYAALSAAACGIALGMNLVEISEALHRLKPQKGRLRLLGGISHSWILDDTYNASPASTLAAIEVMKSIGARRNILVLGDMKELGKYTETAHRNIGNFIFSWAHQIWTVGNAAKLIGQEALDNGFDQKSIFHFNDSSEAGKVLQDKIQEGDLILVKGSQSMRMERIVKEIMAEPEKASDLLVRQEGYWQIN